METPRLWIVAGPNGAGKTTSVQREPIVSLLPQIAFLNPDDITLQKIVAHGYHGFADAPRDVQIKLFFEAADEVNAELRRRLEQGESVGVETVLSSDKYCSVVDLVLEMKGYVGLIYVALSTPALAQARVAARVRRGGHGVPEEKIASRWRRSLEFLPWFAHKATLFWVVDNSDSDPTKMLPLLASGRDGYLEHLDDTAFPELKAALSSLTRAAKE